MRFNDDGGRLFSTLKWTLLCAFLVSSSLAFARTKRYIVRIGDARGIKGSALTSMRQSRLSHLSNEVDKNIPGARTLLKAEAFGMLVVEGDEHDGTLEDALDRHPLVEYYEEDVEYQIAVNPSTTNPSGHQLAPWLRDVMGLSVAAPSAVVEYPGTLNTIVAVIDTGANVTHPYLKPAIAINTTELNGVTGIDDDNNGVVDDIYGANFASNSSGTLYRNGDVEDLGTDHGTHVAGLVKSVRDQAIAFRSEGLSPYAGTASRVKILPIRFINESQVGTTSGAIAALNYAVSRGASVINCSWGARGEESFSQALYDAMVQGYRSNIVISIAAGNAESAGPNDNNKIPYFPSSFNIPGVISVGSVTPEHRSSTATGGTMFNIGFSDFSNYGSKTVHVAAPGGFRDENGNSAGVWSSNAGHAFGGAEYVRKKGTSMAAPVVAGVMGVMRAINPQLSAYEIKEIVLATVTKDTKYRDAVISSGVVNARAAFLAAAVAVTNPATSKPAVPADPYLIFQSATEAPTGRSGGGCGAVHSVVGSSGEGPSGGNSLLLFAGAYLASIFVRALRRKNKHTRV